MSEDPRNVAEYVESSQRLVQQEFVYGRPLQVERAKDPPNMTRVTALRMFACPAAHGFSLPAG